MLRGLIGAGRTVAVTGHAGVGKSTLALAALAGIPHLHGGGLATLADRPFFAIERALRHSVVGTHDEVADELVRAVDGALLLIDDLHWVDAHTLAVLQVVQAQLAIVVVARTGIDVVEVQDLVVVERFCRVFQVALVAAAELVTKVITFADPAKATTVTSTVATAGTADNVVPELARVLVDVRVELTDGDYHDVDSSEMAFKIAGSMAFKEAARKAKPTLLEPIMDVEVVTPEDYMGDVIGDLNSRRGKVGKMEQRGANQVIDAEVPLSEMFGYSTDLRSKTQGRANYTMHFGSYQATPRSIQEEIVARVTGR